MTAPIEDVVSRWRDAGEAADVDAMSSCLAPGVELVSPLTAQFRFTGRDRVRDVLAVALDVIEDIRFHTVVREGATAALFSAARIGAQPLEEAQLLEIGPDGLVERVTVLVRPLPAVTALMSALGPELVRRGGRRGLATFLAVATAPLHGMARLGERRIVPLAEPGSPDRRP